MAAVKPYYAPGSLSARFYDVATAADARLSGDLDIYAGLAPPGGEVLELGAGSGRLTAGLAERGFAVTGVDLSRPMLEQALARRDALPAEVAARVALRLGDMTALDLKRGFDLVICPYFTLAHVPVGQAWKNSFAVAARHLKPGGRAAFHLPRLELMRAGGAAGADPALRVLDEPLPSGGRLQLHVIERRFREDLGRLDQVIEYVERDARGAVLVRSPERLTYFMADPAPFATAAGLARVSAPIPLGEVGDVWVYEKP